MAKLGMLVLNAYSKRFCVPVTVPPVNVVVCISRANSLLVRGDSTIIYLSTEIGQRLA